MGLKLPYATAILATSLAAFSFLPVADAQQKKTGAKPYQITRTDDRKGIYIDETGNSCHVLYQQEKGKPKKQ